MEGIVIFIVFMVFSVLRSLGDSQQKQQGHGRGPASPPVRPVRPGRPVAPNPRPYDLPVGYEDLVMEAESDSQEEREPLKTKPALRKKVKKGSPILAEDVHYAIKLREGVTSLQLDRKTIVQGFIISEVIGSSRAKARWSPRK